MTVPFKYNFKTLSNKIPRTPPRRFFGDLIYFFDPVFFFHFCFRGLIRNERKKCIRRKEQFHFGQHCPFFGDINSSIMEKFFTSFAAKTKLDFWRNGLYLFSLRRGRAKRDL